MNREKLRTMFWDYNVAYSQDQIYDFLVGEKDLPGFNRNQVLARMLISIRWYDLVDIFGIKQLSGFLTDDVIKFIWKKSLRERFENVRKILQPVL